MPTMVKQAATSGSGQAPTKPSDRRPNTDKQPEEDAASGIPRLRPKPQVPKGYGKPPRPLPLPTIVCPRPRDVPLKQFYDFFECSIHDEEAVVRNKIREKLLSLHPDKKPRSEEEEDDKKPKPSALSEKEKLELDKCCKGRSAIREWLNKRNTPEWLKKQEQKNKEDKLAHNKYLQKIRSEAEVYEKSYKEWLIYIRERPSYTNEEMKIVVEAELQNKSEIEDSLRIKLEEKTATVKELETQLEKSNECAEQLRHKLQMKLDEVYVDSNELRQQRDYSASKVSELTEKINEVTHKFEEEQEKLKLSNLELDQRKVEFMQLENNLTASQCENELLRSLINDREAKNSELSLILCGLVAEAKNLNALQNEITSKESEFSFTLAKYNAQILELQSELNTSRSENDLLLSDLEESNKLKKELRACRIEMWEKKSKKDAEILELLEQLEKSQSDNDLLRTLINEKEAHGDTKESEFNQSQILKIQENLKSSESKSESFQKFRDETSKEAQRNAQILESEEKIKASQTEIQLLRKRKARILSPAQRNKQLMKTMAILTHCTVCKEEMDYRALAGHKRKRHEDKQGFACTCCKRKFTRDDNRRRHERRYCALNRNSDPDRQNAQPCEARDPFNNSSTSTT